MAPLPKLEGQIVLSTIALLVVVFVSLATGGCHCRLDVVSRCEGREQCVMPARPDARPPYPVNPDIRVVPNKWVP